ncbi:2OG-Fe(II) oxygenase family protein [Sphingobium sp.]|uniref:2OG-Fe(II) oxygenase n=1 Tax=Sphingobium sp. TaxID=1912891 RepID=UPI0025F3A5A0|nr:2OG-Fe(II) oxygenase family protein [Sphingobium sp.]
MPQASDIAIHSDIDILAWQELFGARQRIQIPNFLTASSADTLRDHLQNEVDWTHVINGEEKVFEIASGDFDALDPSVRKRLNIALYEKAASAFQFQFDNRRVSDIDIQQGVGDDLLHHFGQWINSPQTLGLFRNVTGRQDIGFADVQATRYRSGDFLTGHDDVIPGKDRLFAYVLNLSDNWRTEWGGLLLFHDVDSRVAETFVPIFNSISLFSVGQPHSVSYVTPFAQEERLSITGWLRKGVA